jgi:hypothetical protein
MGKRKSTRDPEQAKNNVRKLLKAIEKRVSKQVTNDAEQLHELQEGLDKILASIPDGCCMLPHHQHPVRASRRVCANDSTHVFCKRHRLDKCVICGGDLE